MAVVLCSKTYDKKYKLCRACYGRALPKLLIFWNLTPENISDRQQCVKFSKVGKSDVFSSDNATVVEDKYFFLNYVYVEKR